MKILILGPLDYPSVKADLTLMNYNENVYSVYYAFEGFFAKLAKEGHRLDNQTALMLYLAENMTQKEYDSSEIFFGLAPKKYHFDIIIEYNYNTLMAQEALAESYIRDFQNMFYTTADITHSCENIMEAIKLAQSEAIRSGNEQI